MLSLGGSFKQTGGGLKQEKPAGAKGALHKTVSMPPQATPHATAKTLPAPVAPKKELKEKEASVETPVAAKAPASESPEGAMGKKKKGGINGLVPDSVFKPGPFF